MSARAWRRSRVGSASSVPPPDRRGFLCQHQQGGRIGERLALCGSRSCSRPCGLVARCAPGLNLLGIDPTTLIPTESPVPARCPNRVPNARLKTVVEILTPLFMTCRGALQASWEWPVDCGDKRASPARFSKMHVAAAAKKATSGPRPEISVRRGRRALSVGESPTRQLSLQPVAIGAVVEVTKRPKPSV